MAQPGRALHSGCKINPNHISALIETPNDFNPCESDLVRVDTSQSGKRVTKRKQDSWNSGFRRESASIYAIPTNDKCGSDGYFLDLWSFGMVTFLAQILTRILDFTNQKCPNECPDSDLTIL